MQYTIKTTNPGEIVTTIKEEVKRRLNQVKAKAPGARTQKESARFAGEISSLESIVWMLEHTRVEEPGTIQDAKDQAFHAGDMITLGKLNRLDATDAEIDQLPGVALAKFLNE